MFHVPNPLAAPKARPPLQPISSSLPLPHLIPASALAEAQEGEQDRPADVDPASQPGAAIVMDLRERSALAVLVAPASACRFACRAATPQQFTPISCLLICLVPHPLSSTHARPTAAVMDPNHPERTSALHDYNVRQRGARGPTSNSASFKLTPLFPCTPLAHASAGLLAAV